MNPRTTFAATVLIIAVTFLNIVQAGEPILIAHRGLLRHAPENTIPAFATCVELGMGFELDIRTTKDGLFEQFMAMRNDWADGKLAKLDTDYEAWRTALLAMVERYRDPADKTYVQGRHGNPRWNDNLVRPGYTAGTRMERNFVRLGPPMLEWKWKHNPGPEMDSYPWTAPAYDDRDWPAMHVVRDTWSSIGHHLSMTDEASGKSGRMACRASQKVDAWPRGKKAFLWIGMTDGRAKIFVNGQHIEYVVPEKTKKHEAGTVLDAFDGYCKPASFDITSALKAGENQITILAERHVLNELGTGGLMGPVVLYREK